MNFVRTFRTHSRRKFWSKSQIPNRKIPNHKEKLALFVFQHPFCLKLLTIQVVLSNVGSLYFERTFAKESTLFCFLLSCWSRILGVSFCHRRMKVLNSLCDILMPWPSRHYLLFLKWTGLPTKFSCRSSLDCLPFVIVSCKAQTSCVINYLFWHLRMSPVSTKESAVRFSSRMLPFQLVSILLAVFVLISCPAECYFDRETREERTASSLFWALLHSMYYMWSILNKWIIIFFFTPKHQDLGQAMKNPKLRPLT